jgi:hypothetical protein
MRITGNAQVIPPARQDCRVCGDQTALPGRVYRESTRKLPLLGTAGFRAYQMNTALNDWDDRQASEIPVNCRRRRSDGRRPLANGMELSDANPPSTGKLTDLVMLVLTGGKERNTAECRGSPAKGGLAAR